MCWCVVKQSFNQLVFIRSSHVCPTLSTMKKYTSRNTLSPPPVSPLKCISSILNFFSSPSSSVGLHLHSIFVAEQQNNINSSCDVRVNRQVWVKMDSQISNRPVELSQDLTIGLLPSGWWSMRQLGDHYWKTISCSSGGVVWNKPK